MNSSRSWQLPIRRVVGAVALAFATSLCISATLMQRTNMSSAAMMASYAEVTPEWVFTAPDTWPSEPGQSGRTAITGVTFISQRKWSGLDGDKLFEIPDLASYSGPVRIFFQYRLDAGWPFRAHGIGRLEVADSAIGQGAARGGHTTIWTKERGHLIALDKAPWTPASPRLATALPGLIRPMALLGNVLALTPLLFGVLSVPSFFRWRRRCMRTRAGRCPACGYESAANTCPECGSGDA